MAIKKHVYFSEYLNATLSPMQQERREGADSFDSEAKKTAVPNKPVSMEDRS